MVFVFCVDAVLMIIDSDELGSSASGLLNELLYNITLTEYSL